MPTCTPVYLLPYPIGSDPPCDVGGTLCAFATAVEAELDRLDAVVDRVVDSVPMAQVRQTITRTYAANPGGGTPAAIQFDTVDVDTADMVDLAANPFLVQLPRFGRYHVYGHIVGDTVGASNSVSISVSGDSLDQYLDDGSTPIYANGSIVIRYSNTAPADTSTGALTFTVSVAAVGPTITAATFGVYWLGDLP
jgi:hypothetical protein